jgi:hypothetical protein
VNGPGQDIGALYFGYRWAALHEPGCPRQGTDSWEATQYIREGLDGEVRETVLRLACHDCGAVTFETTAGPAQVQHARGADIGYGRRPEKTAGLWLHPGPRLWPGEEHGPREFLVTRTPDRPREPGDAVGKVAWQLGPRGGIRWTAGLGVTSHGTARADAGRDFPSRHAAVAWIALQPASAEEGHR